MNGYALLVAVIVLAALAALLIIGRVTVVKNTEDHKTIRHEIKVGDSKLQIQIDVLKGEKS